MFHAIEPNVTRSVRFYLRVNDPNDLHRYENRNFKNEINEYFYATKIIYQMYRKRLAVLKHLHLKCSRTMN